MSRDGEEGYPGKVTLTVTYTLTPDNALRIDYRGTTDKPTILNPTHHSYFNLSGDPTQTILDEELTIDADQTTAVGAGLIPTGKLVDVAGTPMDFRQPTKIGARIDANDEQLVLGKGYDHNWVLRHQGRGVHKAAELFDATSGIVMQVLTDQPGLQFYSGNFLDGTIHGKEGVVVSAADGVVPGGAAVPGRAQPPGLPERRAPARATLQADHHLPVLHPVGRSHPRATCSPAGRRTGEAQMSSAGPAEAEPAES